MARRIETPEDAWTRFSASKLSAFTTCPLRGALDYIIPEPAPLNPYAAQGIALHGLFEAFFRRHPSTKRFPYDTPKKFMGIWSSLWNGAIHGEHGFKGKGKDTERNPVELVAWDYEAQPKRMLEQGFPITAIFHRTFHELRQDGRYRRTEAGFGFPWEGLRLTGIIDRLDRSDDGAILLDYKSKDFRLHELQSGIQMTYYQLAYEEKFRRQKNWRVPLKQIQIYNYKSGTFQYPELRSSHEFGLLLRYLEETSGYIYGVLHGHLPKPQSHIMFRHYDPRDIERGDITPRLPRGDHCGFCRHYIACRQWELGRRPTIRSLFAERWNGTPAVIVRQRPMRHDTVILRGTKRMRRTLAQNEAQLKLEL